jgi:hypothetical protein
MANINEVLNLDIIRVIAETRNVIIVGLGSEDTPTSQITRLIVDPADEDKAQRILDNFGNFTLTADTSVIDTDVTISGPTGEWRYAILHDNVEVDRGRVDVAPWTLGFNLALPGTWVVVGIEVGGNNSGYVSIEVEEAE